MRRLASVVVVVVAVSASALGQDRASMVDRVRRASAQADAAGASASDRIRAIDRAIEVREVLIRSLPGDSHQPIWLLDQAADMLTRQTLAMADARLVVGLLDRSERDDVLAAAEAAYASAERAGALIEARFEQHRGILEAGGELAEGDRTLNRRLADTERAVRRPLLMGRAMALRVSGGGEGADARQVINLLDGLKVGSDAARVIRENAMAIAMVEIGGAHNLDRARALLDGMIADGPADAGSIALAEAALLRGRLAEGVDARAQALAEASDRAPFVDEQGLRDPALLVLALEARARVLAEGGQLESAARTIIGIEERRDLAGTPRQWSALADDRLASLAQGVDDWSDVAADVVLRAARALVAQDRPGFDARAESMLAELLERFESQQTQAAEAKTVWLEPTERAPAMELLARLYLAESDSQEDQARAVVLVGELIDAPGADLSVLLPHAASLALGPVGDELEREQRLALLEAALARTPEDANADRWRLGLAAILVEAGAQAEWPRILDLAGVAMRSSDAATRDDAVALAGAAHGLLVAQARDNDRSSLPTLRRALDFVREHPSATNLDARALGLRIARALIATGRRDDAAEAVAALRGLAGKDALVLRARALDQVGSSEEAFAAYREARELVTPEDDGATFWRVCTRLLELADAERKRRSEEAAAPLKASIRTQLLQLKAIDAGLGGPPWSNRLRAIEAGLDA